MGRTLDGRYRLETEIGAGGLGVVYRATHEKLDKPVAVKLLHAHCGENEVMRGRFEREARALASLDHPNIVAVTDYGIADDTPYLVMELLEGETLAERLAYGPLDQTSAETLAGSLLRALAFVHARGLVHRDVKPGNVFLQSMPDGSERLKVLDFGLAKLVSPFGDSRDATLTRAGTVVGTPAYMSPEQASGEAADARSDVYAAGVIILQMLAGRLPFTGDAIEQLRSHLIAPVPKLVQLCSSRLSHPEFDAFIERAMTKRREERFDNAGDMLAALEALPRPWFSGKGGADSPGLGTAKTLLAGDPVTLAMSGPPSGAVAQLENSGAPERTAPNTRARTKPAKPAAKRKRRGGGLFLLSFSAAALALATTAYRGRHPQKDLGLPATVSLKALQDIAVESAKTLQGESQPAEHIKTLRGESQPAARARTAERAGAVESANTTAEDEIPADSSATTEPLAEESARHTQPIESEVDEMPVLANAPPKQRSAARNPWRLAVPKELRALRSAVQAGGRGSDHMIASLRRYNRQHPNDVRGHLLLAGLYLNRDWRADGIAQYSIAYDIDPSSRGAPEMLSNLVGMVAHGFAVNDAEKFIEHAYRTEAIAAIDRAMRARHDDARAVSRLTGLKARLTARPRP
jgi:serine/threonine-protein kinase